MKQGHEIICMGCNHRIFPLHSHIAMQHFAFDPGDFGKDSTGLVPIQFVIGSCQGDEIEIGGFGGGGEIGGG